MTRHPVPGMPLTAREVEVVALVADGCSNVEIGRRLFLSELTVKTHLRRIGHKCGTGDRAGIVGVAFRTGLLRVPSGPDPLMVELLAMARAMVAGRPAAEFQAVAARAVRVADARSAAGNGAEALSASVSASQGCVGSGTPSRMFSRLSVALRPFLTASGSEGVMRGDR